MRPSMLFRLRGLSRSLLLASGIALAGAASAQGTAIKVLVGFPPGGGTDAIARVLADKLKDQLGVPVIVENKAGAGGQLAAQALKAAAPDGNTLFLTHDHSVSILPLVMKNPGFDPAKDFVAVAGFATFVNALAVSGGTPAKSVNDYVAWVRSQGGGKGTVGVPAPASVPEFLVKVVGQKYSLDLQAAPYRGSAPMMADMLGNQIAAGVASIPDFIENHKAGKIRVVAVMGGARQAVMPDVPTFAELAGVGTSERSRGPLAPWLEGESLVPSMKGPAKPRERPLFWEMYGNRAVRDGRWKLVWGASERRWQLYDLATDRSETRDLAAVHPERVEALATAWSEWAERTGNVQSREPGS